MRPRTSGPWLDRLQAGDQLALGELFSRYRDRLGRMIQFRLDGRLRGRVAASDVLQEAYIDALKRLPHFQAAEGMPFLIWLRWVTMQRLVEVHRQHLGARMRDAGREVAFDAGGSLAASSEKIADFIGDQTSPSQAAERAEAMDQLRQALDEPRPHRSRGAGPPALRGAEQPGGGRRPGDPARRRQQAIRAGARTPQGGAGGAPGAGRVRDR